MATIYINYIGEVEHKENVKPITKIEQPVEVLEVKPKEIKQKVAKVILPEIETLPATFEIPVEVAEEIIEPINVVIEPIEPEFDEITEIQLEPIVPIKHVREKKIK